jgi:hypothetical protein
VAERYLADLTDKELVAIIASDRSDKTKRGTDELCRKINGSETAR